MTTTSEHRFGDGTPRSMYERADLILGAFDADHISLGLVGLMARTGLPKTTMYRSIEKMVQLRWLERHDGGRFCIGARLFELAGLVTLQVYLRAAALPTLEDLYEATHETIHLAVLDGDQILYVEKLAGHRGATPLSRVGGRMPAYCTGLGKVLTAHASPNVRDTMLRRGLVPRTTATIVSVSAMERELARICDEGAGFDREECAVGLACVAAPVTAVDGSCAAAVSITGSAQRLPLSRLVPRVRGAALEISRELATRTSISAWRPLPCPHRARRSRP